MLRKVLLVASFVAIFVASGFSYTHVEGTVKIKSLWAYEDFGVGDVYIETHCCPI